MSIIVHNMWSNAWSISELSKTKNARYLLKAILQEVMPKSLYIVLGFSFQGAKIADNISIEMSKLICLKRKRWILHYNMILVQFRQGNKNNYSLIIYNAHFYEKEGIYGDRRIWFV